MLTSKELHTVWPKEKTPGVLCGVINLQKISDRFNAFTQSFEHELDIDIPDFHFFDGFINVIGHNMLVFRTPLGGSFQTEVFSVNNGVFH